MRSADSAPAAALERVPLLERLLPLRPWLSAESSIGIEEGQSRTRLVCALIGLGGLATIGQFQPLPGLVLFSMTFLVNTIAELIRQRLRMRYRAL